MSLSWGRGLLLLLGASVLAVYLGFVSWGPVDEAIQWLATKADGRGTLEDPVARRGESYLVVISFLFLTPVAGLIALFLFVFVLMVLAGMLSPVGRVLRLPNWAFMVLLTCGLAGIAYAKTEMWLPWVVWMSGLVANAFLSLAQ